MATFYGQTVDVYEDFEDALGAGWTETDTDTNVAPNSTTQKKEGAAAAEFDFNGVTDGGESSYLGYDIGGAVDPASYGFWLYCDGGADATFTHELIALASVPTSMGTYACKLYLYRSAAGAYAIRFRGASGYDTDSAISTATWYWVTVKTVRNDTCSMNIYSAAQALLYERTVTGYDNGGLDSLTFGSGGTTNVNEKIYFDELVIDWTSAAFPLLGWAVGGGAVAPTSVFYGPFGGPFAGPL